MSKKRTAGVSRRQMIQSAAAASAFAGLSVPQVHAGESNTVQVALIGCGGRGTGAAANALSTRSGPIKLVAMADVFPEKLNSSYQNLAKSQGNKVDVPENRRFVSFDGYKQAMDCLRPGDVAILTTPPAFRWPHFDYAIQKGINVFMEKPVTVDGASTRKLLKLNEDAERKNLKVGVGLMCRHCDVRQEQHKRIQDGAIGDITLLRAYRMTSPVGSCFSGPKPAGISELMYQIQRFHSFLWASGGCFSDFLIHNIDECCWMKNAWPVSAKGSGGRHYRGDFIDQNFDTYSVEYTFADGTKMYLEGRNMPGCHQEFASYAHGTKGSAIISTNSHTPARSRLFKGHNFTNDNIIWRGPAQEPNPYQLEWDRLIVAIRKDEKYNEVKRGAEASLVTAMGRMACHTGRIVTYDDALNHEHDLAPEVDRLTLSSAAPLVADANGKYPIPRPGIETRREF